MKELILAVLMGFTPYHLDTETTEERTERLEVVAESIEVASEGDREVMAFLVMTAHRETRMAQHVHAGNCREGECDNGRAASLWQIQSGSWIKQETWEGFIGLGLEPTTRAAQHAAMLYRRGVRTCGSPTGAIALYGTGRTCFTKSARIRRGHMNAVLKKLR